MQLLLPLAQPAPVGQKLALCTANGVLWIDAGHSAPADGGTGAHSHCPFCCGHPPLAAAVPPPAQWPLGHAARSERPAAKDVPSIASAGLVLPPVRGPPAAA